MGRKPRVDRSREEKWQIVQEGSAWGEKRCRGGNREGPSHPAVGTNAGAEVAGDRNPKKRRGGVSCGAVHSQAREMVTEGYTATLVAATLAISGRVCTTGSGREAAGLTEPTMSRS